MVVFTPTPGSAFFMPVRISLPGKNQRGTQVPNIEFYRRMIRAIKSGLYGLATDIPHIMRINPSIVRWHKIMIGRILIYLGAALPLVRGVSHLFPTQSVVRGFGDISQDNKYIISMEWIVEGVALIFTGALILLVTFIDPSNIISIATYIVSSCFLIIMAIVSLFTGFKIDFLPFRLCPLIFTSSGVLISIGWLLII